MKNKGRWIIASGILFLKMAALSFGADAWHTKANLHVEGPGIVETVLPPELYVAKDNTSIDLVLKGPDGKPRSFELYRREQGGRIETVLTPVEVILKNRSEYVWEGKADQVITADHIGIEVADETFLARVDVEGLLPDGWISLKKDTALFNANGQRRTHFDINQNRYERIRLTFRSFDKKYNEKFSPILKVVLAGDRIGKIPHETTISPEFQYSELETITEIRVMLPGSGLWIDSIRFNTQAQFQGTLEAGIETITQGRQTFSTLKRYQFDHVYKDKQQVAFEFKGVWPGRSLLLRLDSKGMFIGRITDLSITVLCPRMVFLADLPGTYGVESGTGKIQMINEYPGDSDRPVDYEAVFSVIETNASRRPASLVERYRITGGPFHNDGYSWRSTLWVPAPGYYRLILNMAASLEKNPSGVRLVKEKFQVPFLFGREENRELDLMAATDISYDADQNETSLTVVLPKASPKWSRLTLYGSGIFRRSLAIETPKAGNMGWEEWRSTNWESRNPEEARLSVRLDGFPGNQNRLRIVVDHGDNEPIEIHRITVAYAAPSLIFIARESGEYDIYGGNSRVGPPVYDLSLVQASLLEELPQMIHMEETTTIRTHDLRRSFEQLFSEKGWGLYGMLGLVTLVLLIVIVRLFPTSGPK